MAITERSVGSPVLRKEDPEFLTGRARYTDDLSLQGMLWMAVVRSPYAHARVKSVDVSNALAMDGVVAAFSGRDFEWAGPLLMAWPVTEDINSPPHYPLAAEKARYQGDGVAVVVAESRALAEDAAETIEVDFEPLPAVADVEAALAEGAPLVHDEFGTNRSYSWKLTNGDVNKVFSEAPVVVEEHYRVQRQGPNAMEARAILVEPNMASGQFPMWTWTETRSEGYLATHHGRDQVQKIELAANEDGKILGYRTLVLANMGAYLRIIAPGTPVLGAFLYCGCYEGEAYQIQIEGVFTNTTPVDAYRGAGRPEATNAIERAIDALARRVRKDPVEIRRMNFMPPFTEATASVGGLTIDSGNYPATLDQALELFDYDQLRKEQQARRESGDLRQLGIGFSTYLENCGWGPSRVIGGVLKYAGGGWEAATVRCHPTGKVVLVVGTTPHGQGNETTFAQIVSDQLGVPVDDVEVLFGDTDIAPSGWDTYGSRSAAVGTPAVSRACRKVIEKARKIAAHELEVAASDLDYEAGGFHVKGAPAVTRTIGELAFSAWRGHNLSDGVG